MDNIYETDKLLAEYLLFHYGSAEEVLPWAFGPADALAFPVRTARAVELAGRGPGGDGRALDLGCAVGRSTFELARYYGQVTGVDYSRAFIEAARRLARGESVAYTRADEGEVATPLQASAPGIPESATVRFEAHDASGLPGDWAGFDAVHAANLLCRLPDPMKLVARFPQLVAPGGILVLATPCTWLEDFTPREAWLGGYVEGGRPVHTLDRLRTLLGKDFEETVACDEPFLIREHARKYQWSVAQLSVWKRR